MVSIVFSKKLDNIIHCVFPLYNLSVRKLRSKYDLISLYYLHMSICLKYFLYFYRQFYRTSIIYGIGDNNISFDYRTSLSNIQFNLFNRLYSKLNNYSIFYHIRRKRKQRRSLFLVLAFDRHVCFKNIEREYLQVRFIYSRCL